MHTQSARPSHNNHIVCLILLTAMALATGCTAKGACVASDSSSCMEDLREDSCVDGGKFHKNVTCASLGYTQASGISFVKPGTKKAP